MKTFILISIAAFVAGCSTTTIENAEIKSATFNTATWKSQAGVGTEATIEATTTPAADTTVGF